MAIEDFDQVTIAPAKLRPFSKFIMSIGELPTSYLDSLSYAEQVTWFCDYLQNHVIPALNNNASALQEVQNLMTQLQEYVDNYFTNLDVQEEINNKLDQMASDGTLTNLIKNYVDPFIDAQNERINTIENIVSAINGSPLVASSTSEMTDTTRIYVNITDGKWYYYDGDSWEIGGTYQSTGIGEGTITFEQLDYALNGLFIKNINFIEKTNMTDNYRIIKSGTSIDLVSDNNYKFYKIDISNYVGKLLMYFVGAFTNLSAVYIADNNDEVLYVSPPNTTATSFIHQNGIIKITNDMKYIYLSCNKYHSINNIMYEIGILDNFKNNYNYDEKTQLNEIEYEDGYYIHKVNTQIGDYTNFTALQDYTIYIYKTYKGAKYQITGVNKMNACAFVLTDNNQVVYEKSTDDYEQDESFTHTFTCSVDGFIITTYSHLYGMDTNVYVYDKLSRNDYATSDSAGIIKVGESLEINENGVLNINTSSYLSNYKVGFTGDSICAGNGYNGGYAKILHDTYGLQIQNIGVSGGHITDDEITPFVISNSIDDLDNDCDAYIIEGGINDYGNGVPFGEITGTFTSTIDQETFCGALEKICRDLYTYHPGKHYAFLIVHNVLISYYNKVNDKTFMDFRNAIYDICNKYSVDVIDIAKNESMLTYYEDIREDYTMQYQGSGDGLHPNQAGYTKFYVPEIKAWLDKIFKL